MLYTSIKLLTSLPIIETEGTGTGAVLRPILGGINGEQMKTSIFIGPTYYQRLKIMVADKMFSRSTGPLQHLTNQPAAGRANKGGLRIGEMERDSIIAHGSANFLQESMLKRSDDYNVFINEKTGFIFHNNDLV